MTTSSSKAPWGDTPEIEWDDENVVHLAAHGVSVSAVEEMIFLGEYDWWRHPRRKKKKRVDVLDKYANRYLIRGATLGGLKLILVIARLGESRIRPVTALKER